MLPLSSNKNLHKRKTTMLRTTLSKSSVWRQMTVMTINTRVSNSRMFSRTTKAINEIKPRLTKLPKKWWKILMNVPIYARSLVRSIGEGWFFRAINLKLRPIKKPNKICF